MVPLHQVCGDLAGGEGCTQVPVGAEECVGVEHMGCCEWVQSGARGHGVVQVQ